MDRATPKIKRPAYRKPEAVKELERLANEAAMFKHPTGPHLAPRKFRDDTANGLTQCIVQYIVLCGGFATRINNQGTWRKKQNRLIPGTSRRGLADVMATYNGVSLHIEVKIGKDRQSLAQKYYQAAIERAGGVYWIVCNFNEFIIKYKELVFVKKKAIVLLRLRINDLFVGC